jgi:thioredoxin-dependent peroxiredoxin
MAFSSLKTFWRRLAVIAAGLFAVPSMAALKEGDVAPGFTLQASFNGKATSFSLKDALRKGPVVVYFYPSAYTRGCNIQAHEFSENMEKFTAKKATVVGVSLDGIARLNDFSADPDYCAGKVTVASDADGKIAKAYGLKVNEPGTGSKDTRGVAIDHSFAERVTFVIASNGKITSVIGGVPAKDNVMQALEAVEKMGTTKK